MTSIPVSQTFNRQEITEDISVDGKKTTVIDGIVLETAQEITLTQDAAHLDSPGYVPVSETQHLYVFGDVVRIHGRLSLPGKNLLIVARRIILERDSAGNRPRIVVDGPPLDESVGKPKALPKGVTPPSNPTRVKIGKGETGSPGFSDRVQPFPASWDKTSPGGPGWSAKDHPDQMNGEDGNDGEHGNPGGNVKILCDSLSQLEVLFEDLMGSLKGTGAADLATNGNPCRLQLMTVASAEDLVNEGHNLVVVAVVGPSLQVRIFDASGEKVVDKAESELVSGENVAALKKHFEIPLLGVLRAGNWWTQDQLEGMSADDQRSALIEKLSQFTNQPADYFRTLNDYDLIGRGAVMVFLLGAGIRDEAGLKASSAEDERNTLIVEIGGRTGKTGPELWPMDNHKLVRLALEQPEGTFDLGDNLSNFRDELALLPEEDQQEIIVDVRLVLGSPPINTPDLAPFAISSPGGLGGDGQPGQEGADGGDGGPGFDATTSRIDPQAGGDGGTGGRGGKGGRGGPGGKGGSVIVHVLRGGPKPYVTVKGGNPGSFGNGGLGGAKGSGGRGGNGVTIPRSPFEPDLGPGMTRTPSGTIVAGAADGKDGKPGDNGDHGDPGTPGADGSSQSTDGKLAPADLLANTHVSQLVMMWQRVRAEYVATDPASDQAAMAELSARLDWVATLLKAVSASSADFPLATAVLPTVLSTQVRISAGLNYFGFGPYDVPRGSVGDYRQYLKDNLPGLQTLEDHFNGYFQALRDNTDALASFDAARSKAKDQKDALDTYRDTLETKTVPAVLKQIDSLEKRRVDDKKSVAKLLAGFGAKIQGSFGLSPETFLNCLSQVSFTSTENPVSATAMLTSQVGTVINEGAKNVLSDKGELVDKSYVLENIQAFESPDLTTDFERETSGFINDSNSYRVIASYDKLKTLIAQFVRSGPEAAAAKQSIQDHLDLITSRNLQIDYYNTLLRDLIETSSEERRIEIEMRIASDALTRKTPGLAPMTNFVFGLYEGDKTDCLEQLYMLYRAQSFWSLSPLSEFYSIIGRSPEAITYDQLEAAWSKLGITLVTDLDKGSQAPSSFRGIFVVLTRDTHPKVFDDLELWSEAKFDLAPATRKSPAPATILTPTLAAWTGSSPPDDRVPNPFHGKANVRLTKVRAWMVGMATSNQRHQLTIEHSGREVLWRDDDKPYPLPEDGEDDGAELRFDELPRVVHAPVRKPFVYDPTGLQLDLGTPSFSPGRIDGVSGAQDGDLNYSDAAELGLPGGSGYAAIGPFTTWRLEVPSTDNPGLDVSKMTAIVMEFDGFNVTFADR